MRKVRRRRVEQARGSVYGDGGRTQGASIHDGIKPCQAAAFRGYASLSIWHMWHAPTDILDRASSQSAHILWSARMEEMGVLTESLT